MPKRRLNWLLCAVLMVFPGLIGKAATAPVQVTIPTATPLPELSGFDLNISPMAAPHTDLFAFASYSSKLVPDDTNGFCDVFLWSRTNGSIRLVSLATNGAANGASYDPALSKDGRFVAFVSSASNLVPNDTNHIEDVFVADLQASSIELITAPAKTTGKALGSTRSPIISGDGRYVAYVTRRGDLVSAAVTAGRNHVFVRDRVAGTNLWANQQVDSILTVQPLAIFDTTLWLTVNSNLYTFNLTNQTLTLIGQSSTEPAFSSDGSFVAMQLVSTGTSGANTIKRFNVATQQLETLMATSNKVVRYKGLSISDNGRIAFVSDAPLVPDDTNTNMDVYVTSSVGGSEGLMLASSGSSPTNASQIFSNPTIARDGERVYYRVFTRFTTGPRMSETFVRDLSAAAPEALVTSWPKQNFSRIVPSPGGVFLMSESNQFGLAQPSAETDLVFLASPAANPDSDGDGLPDSWELAMFGSLSENASGDPDNDGMPNLSEYLAGTDPTRAASVLKLEIFNTGGARHLVYPGSLKPLSVEYRDAVDSGTWTSLQTQATEQDGRPSFLDSAEVPQRIYRIRVLP